MELGIEQLVHFIGEHRDLAPVLADLDAFVLCSLSEGTSIALLEAMSSGIPCVATDVGGSSAVLDGGKSGALTTSSDVRALASAISRILRSAQLARDYSVAGRRRVQSQYSEIAMVQKYEVIYESLIRPEPPLRRSFS